MLPTKTERFANSHLTGEWEHAIVSTVKRFIPESFKHTWHDWRMSMKKTEYDIEGSNQVSEHVDMAGWGVEEADKANKMDASTYCLSLISIPITIPPKIEPLKSESNAMEADRC